jgi:hypothetical protein
VLRFGWQVDRIQGCGEAVEAVGNEASVDVEGDPDRTVADHLLKLLRVRPRLDQQGIGGVAERVHR